MQLLESDKHIFIVMENIEGGNLDDFIIKNKGLTEDATKHILKQLVTALKYLHVTKNIVHRDLKPENLLVESADLENNRVYIKLTDFGFASDGAQERVG